MKHVAITAATALLALGAAQSNALAITSGLDAAATIQLTSTSGSGSNVVYNYDIDLTNTGTTPIGTFWFAWMPGEDFLTSNPTAISQPSGWTHNDFPGSSTSGTSFNFIAGSSSLLQSGQSLDGFTFSTADPLSALAGDSKFFPGTPTTTSFVYGGAPFSDAGASFVVKPPAVEATPLPAAAWQGLAAIPFFVIATKLLGRSGQADSLI